MCEHFMAVEGMHALQQAPFLTSGVIWVCSISDLLSFWPADYAMSLNMCSVRLCELPASSSKQPKDFWKPLE
jgi:hypothetical protein